jgi:hypothetical protein
MCTQTQYQILTATPTHYALDFFPVLGSLEIMNRYTFPLHISSEAYLDYYRGAARHVIARCVNGQTVQFPASLLQQFVTLEGIHGSFVLTVDENNKCIDLQRHNVNE